MWKNIATIPNDKDVLVYDKTAMFVGHYDSEMRKIWVGDYTWAKNEFAYWMPLPEPPK